MKFKELKQGWPIYVFDRKAVIVETGKVANVSVPHLDGNLGGGTNFVVDIEARFAGIPRTFVTLAECDTAYPDGRVISTDMDAIKREVLGMKTQAEEIVSQVEAQRDVIVKSSALLAEIDPNEKQRAATEERFARLEANIAKIAEIVQKLEN